MLDVTPDAVRKWMRGDRLPRPTMASHIEAVSGGDVLRTSFYWATPTAEDSAATPTEQAA
jgi:hypothetical protein